LTGVAAAFEAATANKVRATYGPSGLLRQDIAGGAAAHVFASANMEHPQSLHDAGNGGPVTMFARNTLCALARPGLNVNPDTLLAALLDPAIRIATSTPKADPSGDYAFAVFARAERLRPGARAALEAKALKLTGAPGSAKPPDGRVVYGWHVAEGRADIFLTYRTNALEARQQYPDQQIVALPDALAVGADYGLTVIDGAPVAAQEFAAFIMSASGQAILAQHGFAPPAQ
jgi:ABC-type molybdate transport system substrate-binding protein